ncbi:hypothetical protein TrVE_jg3824 [Triparma verrucosa]|uniref:Uncharacterized protein n=1 Tax=Triparma verrucosa TaxID=1606542 RepID=A0A9W7CES7_9STRA|nr:hypothetical protein TrVE_jg3824 [Triparma verrucosa]
MNKMFKNAEAFDQDLSAWCVEKISVQGPTQFDTGSGKVFPNPDWGVACGPPSLSSCTGIAPYNTSDWDTWCETNCNHNPSYCPVSYCVCPTD